MKTALELATESFVKRQLKHDLGTDCPEDMINALTQMELLELMCDVLDKRIAAQQVDINKACLDAHTLGYHEGYADGGGAGYAD